MAKVLVTGAAGFVGSNLVDSLLSDSHEVFGIDNFCTGSPANIAHLAGSANFTFLDRDIITGLGDFESIKFDQIFHMASPASPPRTYTSPHLEPAAQEPSSECSAGPNIAAWARRGK